MKKKTPDWELTKEEKTRSVEKLKPFLSEQFDTDAGNLRTEMVIDFIARHIGPCFYNRGVMDSMAAMNERVEDLYLLLKDEEEDHHDQRSGREPR